MIIIAVLFIIILIYIHFQSRNPDPKSQKSQSIDELSKTVIYFVCILFLLYMLNYNR